MIRSSCPDSIHIRHMIDHDWITVTINVELWFT